MNILNSGNSFQQLPQNIKKIIFGYLPVAGREKDAEVDQVGQSKFALDTFLENVDTSDIPFLSRQIKQFYKKKPFQGLNIYHSFPIDLIVAIKISAMVIGGANVVVSPSSFANPKEGDQGIKLLKALNVEFRPRQQVKEEEVFDVYMDCGAELLNQPAPRLGYVENTRTGEILFENVAKEGKLPAPVVSVDSTDTKKLETTIGTADGCMRALQEFYPKEYKDGSYVLFGYGNVGSGIAKNLKDIAKNITIIDVSPEAVKKARSDEFEAHLISKSKKCQEAIQAAKFIITATGVEEAISQNFKDSIALFEGKHLINMGFSDEFGKLFSKDSVANGKECFNFALTYPTLWRYLDPTFYAHNEAVKLLLGDRFSHKVHAFPEKQDKKICEEWQKIYAK